MYEDDLESDDPNVYLHHETVLPAYPLCVSWSNFHPTLGYSRGNLAAIGSFLNGIDIWDINEVESIDPLMTLGGYSLPRSLVEKKKGKKKKRPTPTLVPDSHQGEVSPAVRAPSSENSRTYQSKRRVNTTAWSHRDGGR